MYFFLVNFNSFEGERSLNYDCILDENTWSFDTIILLKVYQEGGSFCYVNSGIVEI